MVQPPRSEEVRVSRRLLPLIGLLAGLAPATAHAQTNIDQGKSAAQIFSDTCATCHKSTRGLAAGRGSFALRSFLTEHYTSSNEQAAALAAYVLGAGGGESVPAAQAHPPKPGQEHARLPGEEANPASHRQAKGEEAPGTAKPLTNEDATPASVPSIMVEPGPVGRQDVQPGIGIRGHRRGPEETQPAAVVTGPAVAPAQEGSSAPTPGPSAAAPANTEPGENAPIPRDNIPD
jgi:hypothetical protein